MPIKVVSESQDWLNFKYLKKAIYNWCKRLNFHPALVDWLLVAFVIVYGLIGMYNFDLRMASLRDDDGPIWYAHAFKNPDLFEGDFAHGLPQSLLTRVKVFTSATIWIPTLLWQYLDIDPYPTTWAIALLQGVLLGFTTYILTLAITRNRTASTLATVFAIIADPWHWHLANYGSGHYWVFTPNPAYLVLSFIMLSFIYLIRARTLPTLLLLIVAGLIHPSLGLFACVVVGIYWLWTDVHHRNWRLLGQHLIGLGLASVITVLPTLYVELTTSFDPLPHDEFMAGAEQSMHLIPWNGNFWRWEYSWSTVLKWLMLAALSWRWRDKFPSNWLRLWLAALCSALLLTLSHIAGVVWEIPILMNLIGSRSFQILSLISLPMVGYYWFAHLRSGNWSGATLSILCLAVPVYAAEYGLVWGLIIGLVLVDISQGYLVIWRLELPAWTRYSLRAIAGLMPIIWIWAFLTIPADPTETSSIMSQTFAKLTWGVRGDLPPLTVRYLLVIITVLLGLTIWLFTNSRLKSIHLISSFGSIRFNQIVIWLIIILLGFNFLWIYWQNEAQQRHTNVLAWLETQLWVRQHTPPSSLFATTMHGWRTMSLRRQFNIMTREAHAYIAPRQTKEHRDRLLDFYDIPAEEARELRGIRINQMERERFLNFRESDFLRFASEFGVTHLVLPKRYSQSLPIVYENRYFSVYRLEPYSLLELEAMRHQVETALEYVLLDLSSAYTITEEGETYLIAGTGQKVRVEGPMRLADGPYEGAKALVVSETTRITGPLSAIDMSQGSLAVWARLTDPGKKTSSLVQVNGKGLYIYHQGTDGKFGVYYNGIRLGLTSTAVTDDQWHHYVFTWHDGEQKFYIDGNLALSTRIPANVADTELFAIGWLGSKNGGQWAGILADLITFNRPLSSDEVRGLHQVSRRSGYK